jgi:hydroxylamine reductase (hybrid-cluster protein)
MIDYVEANCIVPPLNSHPHYDEESDMWGVDFEEKNTFNPYNLPTAPISVFVETLEEARELIQKSVELAYNENKEDTQEN